MGIAPCYLIGNLFLFSSLTFSLFCYLSMYLDWQTQVLKSKKEKRNCKTLCHIWKGLTINVSKYVYIIRKFFWSMPLCAESKALSLEKEVQKLGYIRVSHIRVLKKNCKFLEMLKDCLWWHTVVPQHLFILLYYDGKSIGIIGCRFTVWTLFQQSK